VRKKSIFPEKQNFSAPAFENYSAKNKKNHELLSKLILFGKSDLHNFAVYSVHVNINIMNFKKLSKRKITYLALILSVVVVLTWAFISAGIITHNFNREQLKGTENRQEIDISGIILTETKADKKYWEIYGEKGSYNSDNKVAFLENVTGNFYRDNEVTMSFESSKGTYSEEKKQIILYSDTHIVIKDGTSLWADRLIWSGSDKEVLAQGHIRINRKNELIATADRAVISTDYSDFKIIGKTVTKLYDLKESHYIKNKS